MHCCMCMQDSFAINTHWMNELLKAMAVQNAIMLIYVLVHMYVGKRGY